MDSDDSTVVSASHATNDTRGNIDIAAFDVRYCGRDNCIRRLSLDVAFIHTNTHIQIWYTRV